jgi:hypothetical protein
LVREDVLMGGGGKGNNNAPPDSDMTRLGGPWMPMQKNLMGVLGTIRDLNQNTQLEYGPGVVQPWNAAQNAGYQGGVGLAMQGNPAFGQATGYTGGVAGGGNVGAAPGSDWLAGLAQHGADDPASALYGQIAQHAQQGSGGLGYLQGAAAGNYVGSNPYLESNINSALGDVTRSYQNTVVPGLESRMSQSGMLGSSVEQGMQSDAHRDLVDRLGSVESQMRMGDYQNERGLQQQAGLALPGAFGQEVNTALAGAGGQAGDYWQGLQAQLGGAQAAGAGFRQDVGQALDAGQGLESVYRSQYTPYEQLMTLGGLQQQQATQQAQEAQQRFQFQQNAPWQKLQQVLGAYGGVAGMTSPQSAAQYASAQMQQQGGSGMGGLLAGGLALGGGLLMNSYAPGNPAGMALTTGGLRQMMGGAGGGYGRGY